MDDPVISVIIPSRNAITSIGRCLRSLRTQSFAGSYEIVVVDSSDDETPKMIAEQFPEVRLYTHPRRLYPGDARNKAVASARGRILAFIDADCIADPDWLSEIELAQRSAWPAIGGTIDNANPESYVGWAAYFTALSRLMPGTRMRRMVEVPTGCLSLKRWAFDRFGPFPEGILSSDTALSWRLAKAGYKPVLSPRIRVSHTNRHRLGDFLGHQPRHGRDFAGMRVVEQRFSPLKRLVFALLSLILPPLLFVRTARCVATNRRYLRQFVVAAPLVFAGHCAWSLGELVGYVRGPRVRSGGHPSDARRGE